MRHATILTAFGCAAMLLAGAARAEDSKSRDADLEQARQHAAQAKVHYDLGEYEKAAEEYILVYRLRPLPALLFNIAQSYRQAGQYEKAKQFYNAYLRENPDSKTTAQVKQALKEIDELQAKEKLAKNGPPRGVKQPPDTQLPMKSSVAGAAVAGAAAGGAAAAGAPGAASAGSTGAGSTGTGAATATGSPQAAKSAEPAKVATASSAPAKAAAPAAAVTPMTTSMGTTAQAQSSSSGMRTAAWITGGAAVALVAGGALFTMKASSTDNQLNNGGLTRAQADDLISQSNSQHKMGALLLGAGVVAAGTCAVLFLMK